MRQTQILPPVWDSIIHSWVWGLTFIPPPLLFSLSRAYCYWFMGWNSGAEGVRWKKGEAKGRGWNRRPESGPTWVTNLPTPHAKLLALYYQLAQPLHLCNSTSPSQLWCRLATFGPNSTCKGLEAQGSPRNDRGGSGIKVW